MNAVVNRLLIMKASYIFGIFLIALFVAVAAVVLETLGFTYGRYFAYIAVPAGIATLAIGGIAKATGNLEDDLRKD